MSSTDVYRTAKNNHKKHITHIFLFFTHFSFCNLKKRKWAYASTNRFSKATNPSLFFFCCCWFVFLSQCDKRNYAQSRFLVKFNFVKIVQKWTIITLSSSVSSSSSSSCDWLKRNNNFWRMLETKEVRASLYLSEKVMLKVRKIWLYVSIPTY